MIRTLRYAIGRWLIRAGLDAMPPGPIRDDLYATLREFVDRVRFIAALVRADTTP